MRLLPLLLICTLPFLVHGQESDSLYLKTKTNRNICLRTELGWNRSWFLSAGLSYVFSQVNSHGMVSFVAYAAAEANLATYRSPSVFYAYKGGFEIAASLTAIGAELRNNTDFAGNNHLIFMPKAGLSAFGHYNIFYGYNVFKENNNLFGIGRHQVAISVSLNRRVLKESLVPTE